jgi:L-aspartate oxidase
VRPILSAAAGVTRDGARLARAAALLAPLAQSDGPAADPAAVALMIVIAAARREESRGAHCRTDFPNTANSARRAALRLDEALAAAAAMTPRPPVRRARA